MKQFLLSILVLFIALSLLASCLYMTSNGSASQAAETQINTSPMLTTTSGPPPTTDPLSSSLYKEFNMVIEGMVTDQRINELEHIAGPSYQVIGLDFVQENAPLPVLRVKTRCECAENGPCCNPNRTFIVTMVVLEKIYNNPAFQILQTPTPEKFSNMEIWCYDHANLTEVITVKWSDVRDFFQGSIDGFQLWARVTPQPH
jgi:hypothetical protein